MDNFNQGNPSEDSESYIYQPSYDEYQHQNFLYEDSCVFLHNFKDDESSQEKLWPRFPINNDKWQQTDNQVSQSEAQDENDTKKQETVKKSSNSNKKKIIQKPQKKSTRKPRKKAEKNDSKPKESGNPSKFNNFGSFLIGSVAQIVGKGQSIKIENEAYKVWNQVKFVTICKTKLEASSVNLAMLKKLKKDIEHVPRKQGAKKHLFRLVNDGSKDNEEKKECKRLVREELIHQMNQKDWLEPHVNSRNFQPKSDDLSGSKKKERHEAYLIYLTAIREGLITKGQLPKRLTL